MKVTPSRPTDHFVTLHVKYQSVRTNQKSNLFGFNTLANVSVVNSYRSRTAKPGRSSFLEYMPDATDTWEDRQTPDRSFTPTAMDTASIINHGSAVSFNQISA